MLPPGTSEIRDCSEDELYDIAYSVSDDYETIICKPPGDSAPLFQYQYFDATSCPSDTKCTNGNQCGTKGNFPTNILVFKRLNKTENAIFTPTLPAWHIRLEH